MPNIKRPTQVRSAVVPRIEVEGRTLGRHEPPPEPPRGWRNDFLEMDRAAFLKKVQDEKRLLVTDTTFRDAHQSLLD